MCAVVVRYFSSVVQAPVKPVSASGISSLIGRQLVVDTTMSDDSRPQSSQLLRSLSAQTGPSVSALHQQQTVANDRSPARDPPLSAARQMSCPETSPARPLQANSQRVDFASDDVFFGKWLSCVVSHVDDPEKFYCQLSGSNNAERLETLMASIDTYVTRLPPGIGKLRTATLGQPVIAKYAQDSTWYRARVTGALLSCVSVNVIHFVLRCL